MSPLFTFTQIWPSSEVSDLKQTALHLYDELSKLGEYLLKIMAIALDLKVGSLRMFLSRLFVFRNCDTEAQ